jgi:hypothetical protein
MCQALIALAAHLHDVWQPLLSRRLLDRVPQNLSGRFARRVVDGNLTPALIGRALEPAARLRRRLRVLSDAEDTLESLFEQHLIPHRHAASSLTAQGARAQLSLIEGVATHPQLRPQRMHLIPDGRSNVPGSRSSPDALVVYDEIPPHLAGMGRSERLEFTMVTPPVADGDLARRISEAVTTKARGRGGVSQLTTPLVVQGNLAPTWGSVVVHLPSAPPLSRGIVDQVHALLSAGPSGGVYEQYRAMQRYVINQGDQWFSVSRTSASDFVIHAHP